MPSCFGFQVRSSFKLHEPRTHTPSDILSLCQEIHRHSSSMMGIQFYPTKSIEEKKFPRLQSWIAYQNCVYTSNYLHSHNGCKCIFWYCILALTNIVDSMFDVQRLGTIFFMLVA